MHELQLQFQSLFQFLVDRNIQYMLQRGGYEQNKAKAARREKGEYSRNAADEQ